MVALLSALVQLPRLDFTERWSVSLGAGSFSSGSNSFEIVGKRLFYLINDFRKPQIFGCLDVATGIQIWRKTGPVSTASYLDVSPKYLVASTENEVLHLDPSTGKTLWQAKRQSYGSGPVIAGDRMFFEPQKGTLVVIDLTKNQEIWRKKYPFALDPDFGAAAPRGDGLVFATKDKAIVYVAQKDGALRWKQSVGKNFIYPFETLENAVLSVGGDYRALRLKDGKPLWIQPQYTSSNTYLRKELNEIWSIPEDGNLYRINAKSGKLITRQPLTDEWQQSHQPPVPYGNGFLLITRGPVLRLDPQGKPVASFDPQENLSELKSLGRDIVVRTGERIARLMPGVGAEPADLAKVIAKPKLSTADRRAIVHLGRKMVPLLIAAIPKAEKERGDELKHLLVQVAGPDDTQALLDLAQREKYFIGEGEGYPAYVVQWLMEKGEPNELARVMLPRFKAAKDESDQNQSLAFLLRSNDTAVVDELLLRLKDEKSPAWIRGAIYSTLAASGREDVLSTIRALRSEGRRLATPTAGQSATKDTDGDGFRDNVDANPAVAPRPLTDKEQAMAAAFDARFRFDSRASKVGLVDYGTRDKPFELIGWKGGLFPRDKAAAFGIKVPKGISRNYPYPHLRFDARTPNTDIVRISADGMTATVDVGVTYGGLDGIGYRFTLKKFGGEWYSVAMQQTWIS